MDTFKKLEILSEASQYDLACACGTGKNDRRQRDGAGHWLYPVPLPQGGYSILLKTLLSSACANDCKYCPLRSDANARRCTLSADETARVFMDYYRRGKVFGLFLSSGVTGNPDRTMERLNDTVRLLRLKHGFKGYVHLKIIPGASDAAVEEAVSLASAVSLNIETPGEQFFSQLSETKSFMDDIVRPVKLMSNLTASGARFSRVKCTTQFIVGAADENDSDIINYVDAVYNRLNFQRVYFSAYQPGLGDRNIPGEQRFELNPEDHLTREHRLYQCDFLFRQYGFQKNELFFDESGNLPLDCDPKKIWAERHLHLFPVDLNKADKEMLLRIPGVGPATVKKILNLRKIHSLQNLCEIGLKGRNLEKTLPYVTF
ncbi:helix-hairpin-helix domain-containing protein [Lentisphaerota bacterium ZTH]|nr:helix-hairpin-helix domain-containing protein [Lentisphaerota bacterium]WET06042.1 helix-hairpin-helix domain-containing protein [Lentisphaerota bacterium ZTH]